MVEAYERYGVVMRIDPKLARLIRRVARDKNVSVLEASRIVADMVAERIRKESFIDDILNMLI